MSTGKKSNSKHLTYIVQLSGECNLNCRYCYYFGNKPRSDRALMNYDLLEQLITEAADISPQVTFIWHGGEPLLIGIDTFEKILEIQRRVSDRLGVKFENRLQTNATLVTERWAKFFRDTHFGIGVSLDGPSWLHNANRVDTLGKGSFDSVYRGICHLRDAGVKFGLLTVVTKHSLGHAEEIYQYFVDKNIKKFDFLPCVEVVGYSNSQAEFSPESLSPGDFADFMIEVFDIWFVQDDPSVSIRYLKNALVGLLGGHPDLCKFNRSCDGYITVGYDGSVKPCDRFGGYEEFTYGFLQKEGLSEILNGKVRDDFRAGVLKVSAECDQCKYHSICNGGCSWHNYVLNRDFRKNLFCEDRYRVFEHVYMRLKENHPSTVVKGEDENEPAKRQ